MTIRTQGQEGQIKALLNEIQKKRKEQGIRPNTQADIVLKALQELQEGMK